ncbi:MAG: fumarylacetoacetate hydrolase family protein [Kofleriaceae bacterium]|nr:fumarylacetoacetate hydrolase family protein [Myxococcales bacterium]MCB9559512.1 fumarylacetoacetate hydrolase family protein [Kofleriaceae bacterium]MCB9574971.1 fumarylacetoacetate hydrolase family protein [Kofleriaceae bacterium]
MKLQLVEISGTTREIDLVPTKIVGIGVNYRAHAQEMGKALPAEPLMFLKPPSALLPHGGAIQRPGGFPRVDHEGELGVVIGQRAHRVPRDRALDVVLGYVCVNDVSVRELQQRDGQWARAKGYDTFCPIGPRVVAGLDPSNLRIQTRVNGETRQDSTTADLIFDVPTLIAFVSEHMTLEPGDVISTGTPSGVGDMAVGDVVEIEIEGIGVLRNDVVARA